MYDTRDLVKRSEKCLSCHLGTPDKSVDHELIAAGHPDLYFELDSFMSVMPPHWKEVDKDPWFGVRALAVGQAVQLREQLRRVARESQGGIWPEYAELDCFACHHSLIAAKDSWRQERGYAGRRPGNPPWNLSRYVVLRHVIQEADSAAAQQLTSEVEKVYALVTALGSDRKQVAAEAASASEIADRLAQRLNGMTFDQPMTLRLMKSIASRCRRHCEPGRARRRTGHHGARFLIHRVYKERHARQRSQQIRAAINALFQQLDDPSAYNGFQVRLGAEESEFAAAMRSLLTAAVVAIALFSFRSRADDPPVTNPPPDRHRVYHALPPDFPGRPKAGRGSPGWR